VWPTFLPTILYAVNFVDASPIHRGHVTDNAARLPAFILTAVEIFAMPPMRLSVRLDSRVAARIRRAPLQQLKSPYPRVVQVWRPLAPRQAYWQKRA
jgi:hypothetical protein